MSSSRRHTGLLLAFLPGPIVLISSPFLSFYYNAFGFRGLVLVHRASTYTSCAPFACRLPFITHRLPLLSLHRYLSPVSLDDPQFSPRGLQVICMYINRPDDYI